MTPSLRVFLETLIKDELKCDEIEQAITQAARPKSVISPLLFGLGIVLDHVFGSRWLIEELSSLGLSISYDEVQIYKQSILQQQTLQSLSPPPFPTLCQYSADNVDSNIRTLDGTGTFHGMGFIAWYQRQSSGQISEQHVKRMARVKTSDLTFDKAIPIIPYEASAIPALSKFNPISLRETTLPPAVKPLPHFSKVLWSSIKILGTKMVPSPDWTNWSGFIHCVYQNDSILMLQLIDMNPRDETCIYYTLSFIQD